MKTLKELLAEGPSNRVVKATKRELEELHITEHAFTKARTYAKLACEIRNDPKLECGGYLIAPKDSGDRVARDAYLARGQIVGGTGNMSYRLEGKDVIRAGREIEALGCKVLGWWHSHGNYEVFHSPTDAANQMVVLNRIAPSNFVFEDRKLNVKNLKMRVKDGKVFLFDEKRPSKMYQFEVDGDPRRMSVAKMSIVERKKIGFAYSLVVNTLESGVNCYAEIAKRDLCNFCRGSRDVSAPVGVKLFEGGEDFKLNIEEMKMEVRERIRMKGFFARVWDGSDAQRRYDVFGKPLPDRGLDRIEDDLFEESEEGMYEGYFWRAVAYLRRTTTEDLKKKWKRKQRWKAVKARRKKNRKERKKRKKEEAKYANKKDFVLLDEKKIGNTEKLDGNNGADIGGDK